MDKFIHSLKRKYKERLFFNEKQYLQVGGDKLINLQLVETNKREGFCGGLPQHRVEENKVKRTCIVCEDLFNGEKPVKKVIVEGNGGMGKTTLCTMITEGWAEDKVLTQFKCVVFIPLRERDVASAESVSDLLKLIHSSEKICTAVVSDFEDSEGEGLLIVADGWDELGESKRHESSFLYKLLFGRVLPFASVLLTSRPSASADLHSLPCVNRLVEVVGFNEDNIKQYIECEFEKCPKKACGLIEQLTNNPLIQSVCSVPLNCAITCNLWHTLDQQLPTTLTELYTLIILNVMLRNIKKLPHFQSTLSLESFDSIPSQLEPYWWLTCKFAFETLSRDQLVFTVEEVASLFPEGFESNQQILYFGLLQSSLSLLPVGHQLSFHFLHLTFQEYLAALHLVTLPSDEQIEVVIKYIMMSRFEMVWRFFFGLGSDKHSVCSRYVSKRVVCLDEKVLQMFLSLNSSHYLLYHCALESCNEIVSYVIAQFQDGSFPHCNNPYDYIAVLHVLSHTLHCESFDLFLWSCGLTDRLLDRLTNILRDASGKLKVRKLCLDNNKLLTGRGVSDLLNKGSVAFFSICIISLSRNSFHGDCINSIVSSLIHTSCKSLSKLNLSYNPLGVSGIQALERAAVAGVLVHLENLYLSNTLTSDSDINGALLTILLASLSSHCPHLMDLDLSENNLGMPGVCALARAIPPLTVSKSTFSFSLCNTMLDVEAICAFTNCLESSSKLTYSKSLIHHNGNQSQSKSLSALPGKYTLDLDNNLLTFTGALALLKVISSETCLSTSFGLSNTDITATTKNSSLVDMLVPATSNTSNYILTRLYLGKNILSREGVHLLVNFMNICLSLEDLDCNNCKLTSEDIRQILSLLKSTHSTSCCGKLQCWHLWENNIDDVGVASLVEYIPDLFPSLEYVNLLYNPVSDEMMVRLDESLEVNRKRRKADRETRRAREEAKIEAKRAKQEAERETRRVIALYEWVTTQSLPQDQQLLDEFVEMWNEVLEEMSVLMIEELTDSDKYSYTTEEELLHYPQPIALEPSTSLPLPSLTPIRPNDQMSGSFFPVVESPVRLAPQGPERLETDIGLEAVKNSTELEPVNVSEQPTSQSALTITALQNEFNLTDEQIDRPIEERDLFYLGDLFRAWNMYAGDPGLQLNEGEQHTILANPNLINNRMRMKEALKTWQCRNPLTATFRNLLNIVLELSDGGVAKKISLYVKNLK